jgi:hypothetical protein
MITDGNHRPDMYVFYSRTNSGGIIYTNPHAPPERRWLIKHASFGDKYFAEHDDILKWTVDQMRERYTRSTWQ